MVRRDKHQKKVWDENRGKLLEAMRDYESRTVVELAKLAKLGRTTVYKHLYSMKTVGRVTQDGSRFRLTSLWPMPNRMVQAVADALGSLPPQGLRVRITSDRDPHRAVTVNADGSRHFEVQISEVMGVQDSCIARKEDNRQDDPIEEVLH